MRRPRELTPQENALWRRIASSVRPLHPGRVILPQVALDDGRDTSTTPTSPRAAPEPRPRKPTSIPAPAAPPRNDGVAGLDAAWERKLARGLVEPDFTLDLHGATLDAAYARLGQGLNQARTMGARVVLLITGRSRPVDAADRGRMRGAIRAKIGDWIAAGEHGSAIAAIRPAHRRHGGPGALYLILRRRR